MWFPTNPIPRKTIGNTELTPMPKILIFGRIKRLGKKIDTSATQIYWSFIMIKKLTEKLLLTYGEEPN